MGGLPRQLLLVLPTFAVVADDKHQPLVRLAPADMEHGDLHVQLAPVPVFQDPIQAMDLVAFQEVGGLPLFRLGVEGHQIEHGRPHQPDGLPKEPFSGEVGVTDMAKGIGHDHAFLQHPKDTLGPLLLGAQACLHFAALRHDPVEGFSQLTDLQVATGVHRLLPYAQVALVNLVRQFH